jgi:hypothetical protein
MMALSQAHWLSHCCACATVFNGVEPKDFGELLSGYTVLGQHRSKAMDDMYRSEIEVQAHRIFPEWQVCGDALRNCVDELLSKTYSVCQDPLQANSESTVAAWPGLTGFPQPTGCPDGC